VARGKRWGRGGGGAAVGTSKVPMGRALSQEVHGEGGYMDGKEAGVQIP